MTAPRTKQLHKNHIAGERGVRLVRSKLPDYWVVRELQPDYGLDLHVEVFEPDALEAESANTLGEHFFVQVKAVARVETELVAVRSRMNVAKYEPDPGYGDEVEIEVVKFSLDTTTLLTVEAMGAALPVVLCLVDLSTETIFYVCLNDYVTKSLLPYKPNYEDQGSVTVMIPSWNVLDAEDPSFAYLWLLARRSKLYAAFNTFGYQYHELIRTTEALPAIVRDEHQPQMVTLSPELRVMARIFLRASLRLAIWTPAGPGYWSPLEDVQRALQSLANDFPPEGLLSADEAKRYMHHLFDTFRRADNLGRMYEELIREWRLPTALAARLDYHEESHDNPLQS
ncbi:DUF4365 domain-containing protein [Demequina flava]|uniref:DUF4365 domain-containing protein n=1 Tax=Demequina flava TaxID=1095025 RepID=UPI00078578FC|nr:DUF4365 domain-containing protein [Demequina flava]